jgi:hypothetical protein
MPIQSLRHTGSVLLAPIFLHFNNNLFDSTNNGEKLFFLAREGYWLQQAFDRFNQCKASDRSSAYLLTSRAFLFKIGLLEPRTYQYSLNFKFSGSIYQLIRTRFMLSDVSINKAFTAKEQQRVISLPKDMDKVAKLIQHRITPLTPIIEQIKSAYHEYLSDLGYFDQPVSHIVDAGYSGTIQTLLTLIFNHPTCGHYLIASKPGFHQVGHHTIEMRGYLKEGVTLGDGYIPLDRSMFLESLLTSPQGQFQDIRYSPLPEKKYEFFYGRKISSQHHFHLLEQICNSAIVRMEAHVKNGISFTQQEVEQIYTTFVTKRGLFPRSAWPVFALDDDIANEGTVSPLDFFGVRA